MRFIFYLILFYFLFKVIRYFFNYVINAGKKSTNINDRSNGSASKKDSTKYKDIEEADFKDLDNDDK